MGDRGGGRENKGGSLKKSKKNPGSTAAKAKKAPKQAGEGPSVSAPAPLPTGDEPYIDCGSAIISRQFDRDRDRVLQRAHTEGCCAVIHWFADVEKQQNLADLSKMNAGFLYFLAGVHPDNVDRTNKKSHEGWLEKVDEIGKRSECVGILTGLNLARETGTHFAQESLLTSSCKLADKLQLPLVLHLASDGASLERAFELLRGEGWIADNSTDGDGENDNDEMEAPQRVMIHDAVSACGGDVEKIKLAVRSGCMCMVSAAGLADGDAEVRAKTVECVRHIPLRQLVVGTDSPWHTPQNLEDPYLRTLRNEPSNIAAVVSALAEALGAETNRAELVAALRANALQLFGMEALPPEQLEAAPTEKAPATAVSSSSAAVSDSAPAGVNQGEGNGQVATKAASTAPSDEMQQSHFSCQRCRRLLFLSSDVSTHGLDASKSTVFRAGEEGLCSAFIFVKTPADHKKLSSHTGLEIKRDNVECVECGAKLGRYYASEGHCSCGASVTGPVVKITALKVDFFDGSLDAETLAARSRLEAEESERQKELDAELELEEARGRSKKDKKKAKMKSDNRGNFSVSTVFGNFASIVVTAFFANPAKPPSHLFTHPTELSQQVLHSECNSSGGRRGVHEPQRRHQDRRRRGRGRRRWGGGGRRGWGGGTTC